MSDECVLGWVGLVWFGLGGGVGWLVRVFCGGLVSEVVYDTIQ